MVSSVRMSYLDSRLTYYLYLLLLTQPCALSKYRMLISNGRIITLFFYGEGFFYVIEKLS